MTELSSRRHAFRPDLADVRLEGRVASARFVAGRPMQVRHPSIPMRSAPDAQQGLTNEVLLGEQIQVFDDAGGWAWGQLSRDGYVGYVPSAALSADILPPTHRVRVSGTFIYPEPDIKRAPLGQLSLNAQVTVVAATDRFAQLATGGYVYGRHISPIGVHARDFVEVAERLVYTPYLWGGRTRQGLDCSGLVQLAMEAAGLDCPRDSDMQAAELGSNVLVPADFDGLRRGDLVFWPGHVGVLIDSVMLLHANGADMSTVIEPLSQAARRIRRGAAASSGQGPALGPDISSIRRLPALGAAPASTPASAGRTATGTVTGMAADPAAGARAGDNAQGLDMPAVAPPDREPITPDAGRDDTPGAGSPAQR